MPRTSCSQAPSGSQSSTSSLLSRTQPPTRAAHSILHHAVRSLANDQSASPLIRELNGLEQRIAQLADCPAADGRAEDRQWQGGLGEWLARMCDVLQRIDSSTVARPLDDFFPDLDALLLTTLLRMGDGSATLRALLLACCGLLVRAAGRTGVAAAWPRWLLSPPGQPTEHDSALSNPLMSILSAADPTPALLFSSTALLASLSSSPQHAAATSSHLSHHRLLPALGRLYQQQCALVVQRVHSLAERGQRRLLEEMWSDEGKHDWALNEATDEAEAPLSDRQQLVLLERLQAITEAVIRYGRHSPRLKSTCDLCSSPPVFTGLVSAVVSLWECLLAALKHYSATSLANRVRSLSLAALSLMYEATYKSRQQAVRGGAAEMVGHISVLSKLLDPSSASAASFYPLLQTAVQQLTLWLPESTLTCSTVLGSIAAAVLEIATAQQQKAAPHADTATNRAPVSQPLAPQRRLDLAPLMSLLLAATAECVRIVQSGSASADLVDKVDSCMHTTLEAHAFFFRHSSRSDAATLPAFLSQTCSSLVPLAASVLSLTAAATGQPLSAVAVLALNLERLVESCDQCQLLPQLLPMVVQSGLMGWSWRAKERIQQLRGQYQSQAANNLTQLKQLETASRCFDRYLARLMAAMEWWPQSAGGRLQRSDRWIAALDALFGAAQGGCVELIESLHVYCSWRVAANISSSDQLSLVLTLSVALLLNQPLKKPTLEQHSNEEAKREQPWAAQELVLDCNKLVVSVEQLLINEQHKQSSSSSVHSTILTRDVLLRLCLVLLLIERLHRRVASTRAKSALFSFLTASDVSAAHLAISPPFQCCVVEGSPGQWLWQQSTANQAAVLLHDQLLLSILSPSTDSRPTSNRPVPFPPAAGVNIRIERIHRRLSQAAETIASWETAGPLQALVRRWRAVAQRWRHAQTDQTTESQRQRSEEVEALLLATCYLMDRCAHKLATLDLLDPLTDVLASSYHHLLAPVPAAGDELPFPAVDVAAWLVHTLASLLSASSVPQHIPSSQLERIFEAGWHLLLTFTTSDIQSSTGLDRVNVGRRCVQLMNAVLACAATPPRDTCSLLLGQFASRERSRDAIETLIRTGFSPTWWLASNAAVNRCTLRIHLPTASDVGSEERVQLLRLQLQVECTQLCTTLLVGATDTVYAMLDWAQAMAVLAHPCDEMKAAAFHYLAACFDCRVLRFKQPNGAERKYEEENDNESGWQPTEQDMTGAHVLLLAIQACLYPRQRLALSSAALDVLQAMLVSTTAAQQRELLDQPWHTFVVQSCLLALALPESVHSTADERDRRVCQLFRYLYALMGDEGSSGCGSDRQRQRCVAERYLVDVDSRLLKPLLFFPSIDDQPASHPPAIVCRTTIHHYLTLLTHMHHSHLQLPIALTALLPEHLGLIESVLTATCMAAVCPAARAGVVDERDEQENGMTGMQGFGSGGAATGSQLPSQPQHVSASQHSEHERDSVTSEHAQTPSLQQRAPFVVQCVCTNRVEAGAEPVVDKCLAEIHRLLGSLSQ